MLECWNGWNVGMVGMLEWCDGRASLSVDDAPSLSVALKGAPFVTFLVTYVQLLLVLQTSVCNPLSDCTSNFNIRFL